MPATHFDTSPAEYDAQRSGHLGRRRIELFDEAISAGPTGPTVLEIGSGGGFTVRELAGRHPEATFVAVEPDDRLAAYARTLEQPANIEHQHADIAAFASRPDVEGTVDVAISVDVIHHFHDHAADFEAVRRVLRAGGRWIAIEPNIWQLYVTLTIERMKRTGYDEDHFRPWKLEPLLQEAGFSITSRRYVHLLPAAVTKPPAWTLAVERALERFRLIGGSVLYELTANDATS